MITYIIIGVTVLVSYTAFQNQELVNRFIFYPSGIKEYKQWWRFVTHGFLHADFQHLIFNMLTLFFFGRHLETTFEYLFGNTWTFPAFYILALVFSSLPSYAKHKNDARYSALGASGAVSAVLFATILFDPWQTILLKFIIPIPAILFAIGYLYYSNYMSKHGQDNIGHDAHMYGAIFGFVFPIALKPAMFFVFIDQLSHPRFLN